MATEWHDCSMFALAIASNALADRFHASSFGRWEFKKLLLSCYYRVGLRLDDKDTKTTKTHIHPKKKLVLY